MTRRRPLAVGMVVCFAFVAVLITSIQGSSGNAQAKHVKKAQFTALAFRPLKRWPTPISTSTTRLNMTMKKPYALTGPPTTAMKAVAWPTTTAAPSRVIASVSPTTTQPAPVTDAVTTTVAYDPATTGMGAPGSFQACVAWRESSDGQASSDVYGILQFVWSDVIGFGGSPYYASLATQDAAFWRLYDMDGTSPWAPYDGC